MTIELTMLMLVFINENDEEKINSHNFMYVDERSDRKCQNNSIHYCKCMDRSLNDPIEDMQW